MHSILLVIIIIVQFVKFKVGIVSINTYANQFLAVYILGVLGRYNWGERERAPSCGLNGRAVTIEDTVGTRYCACAALRANVAGWIWNRFSPAS